MYGVIYLYMSQKLAVTLASALKQAVSGGSSMGDHTYASEAWALIRQQYESRDSREQHGTYRKLTRIEE